jgi:NAD-dependent SIR2 family protein deacetylase
MSSSQVPPELIEALAPKNCSAFVGAGFSVAAGLPTWTSLIQPLTIELPPLPNRSSSLDIAQYYILEYSRQRLVSRLHNSLDAHATKPSEMHHKLLDLPFVRKVGSPDIICALLRAVV